MTEIIVIGLHTGFYL